MQAVAVAVAVVVARTWLSLLLQRTLPPRAVTHPRTGESCPDAIPAASSAASSSVTALKIRGH